jgi:serine protease Do
MIRAVMKIEQFPLRIAFFAVIAFSFAIPNVYAQLNAETQKLFEKLAPELDSTLRSKFEKAIKESQSAIDFTAEEFIRFRKHPSNPFAGLEKIDPYAEPGLIRLDFKIPSAREREIVEGERQHPDQLQCLQSITASAAQYTVQVVADKQWVSMGTVVVSSGLIITKASELENKTDIVCRMNRNGSSSDLPAKVLRIDDRNDVALLKVDARDLTPAKFVETEIVPGSIIVTPDYSGSPLVMGVISTVKRSLIGINQAYMGVKPINTPAGVELDQITEGGAAALAGLQKGDVIKKLNSAEIHTVTDLVNEIRQHRPGDRIQLAVDRKGSSLAFELSLSGRNINGQRSSQGPQTSNFGAIPSGRRDDFPMVFQHDAPLLPEHCGGPVLDLDGNVIGLNIARYGRVASFAIGSSEVRTLVDRLLRENVALNQ